MTELSVPAEGFTLIEVLVSLLLFTVGLLGYASLQLTVQRFHWEIHQRIYAVKLASYMANQVESNPIAQGCYNWRSVEVGSGQEAMFQCVGVGTLATCSLIHISEPTRLRRISYAVFCLKKKKQQQ